MIQYFMLVENGFAERPTMTETKTRPPRIGKAMLKRKRNLREMTKGKLRQLLT